MTQRKKSAKIVKIFIIIVIFLAILASLMLYINNKNNNQNQKINTCQIEKRDIQVLIAATGTLKTKGTVEIGTQVSGTISKVYFNYNDSVKKGDLLAVLDTKLLEIAVKQAEADLLKVQAQYDLNQLNHQNKSNLAKNKLISNYEFEQSKVDVASSYAQLLSAKANLDKAKTNLGYAYIRSPIDGTILDISVEQGQTVSASTSAPTLFIVAENLDNMEIHASVDESDISKIKSGQSVTFTIESDDSVTFKGTVREVRLNPTTTQNVVNYTVVIDAKNQNNILLPGMTATINFIVEEAKDVYAISNSALRVQPTAKMLADMKKNGPPKHSDGRMPPPEDDRERQRMMQNHDASTDRMFQAGDNERFARSEHLGKNDNVAMMNEQSQKMQHSEEKGQNVAKNNKKERKRPTMIWKVVSKDKYEPKPVKTGITDGTWTQLLNIREDDLQYEYISNIVSGSGGKNKSAKKNNQSQGMGGPPMMR